MLNYRLMVVKLSGKEQRYFLKLFKLQGELIDSKI